MDGTGEEKRASGLLGELRHLNTKQADLNIRLQLMVHSIIGPMPTPEGPATQPIEAPDTNFMDAVASEMRRHHRHNSRLETLIEQLEGVFPTPVLNRSPAA